MSRDVRVFSSRDEFLATRSQPIRQQRKVARQLINLWLTAISGLFDGVTADEQTHV